MENELTTLHLKGLTACTVHSPLILWPSVLARPLLSEGLVWLFRFLGLALEVVKA